MFISYCLYIVYTKICSSDCSTNWIECPPVLSPTAIFLASTDSILILYFMISSTSIYDKLKLCTDNYALWNMHVHIMHKKKQFELNSISSVRFEFGSIWVRIRFDLSSNSVRFKFEFSSIWVRIRFDVSSNSVRFKFEFGMSLGVRFSLVEFDLVRQSSI